MIRLRLQSPFISRNILRQRQDQPECSSVAALCPSCLSPSQDVRRSMADPFRSQAMQWGIYHDSPLGSVGTTLRLSPSAMRSTFAKSEQIKNSGSNNLHKVRNKYASLHETFQERSNSLHHVENRSTPSKKACTKALANTACFGTPQPKPPSLHNLFAYNVEQRR